MKEHRRPTPGRRGRSLEELSTLSSAVGQVCDVSDYISTVRWMTDAAEAVGGLDIIVHNAPASGQRGAGPESWVNNFNVDLMGMVGMREAPSKGDVVAYSVPPSRQRD